jgi:hypothetical protein
MLMNAQLSNTSNLQRKFGIEGELWWPDNRVAVTDKRCGECICDACENANGTKRPFETNIFYHCTGRQGTRRRSGQRFQTLLR